MIELVLKEFLKGLTHLVFPPHCLICKNYLSSRISKGNLCPACLQKIEYNSPPFCLKCSRHLPSPILHPMCKTCRHFDMHFDFAWAACIYHGSLVDLIHQFKYNQKVFLKMPLSHLMIDYIKKYRLDINQFDMIVPIPLSSARLRERGYNQAQLLAQPLSEAFRIPLKVHYLIRKRHTLAQSSLSEKQRWTNIQAAFKIKHSNDLHGKSVLLIDDVLTSAATVSQAAGVLKEAHVKTVGVLTLGITP